VLELDQLLEEDNQIVPIRRFEVHCVPVNHPPSFFILIQNVPARRIVGKDVSSLESSSNMLLRDSSDNWNFD